MKTNDQIIKERKQKRLLKAAKNILRHTDIDVDKHSQDIIKLMLAEKERDETLTIIRTLQFFANYIEGQQKICDIQIWQSANQEKIAYESKYACMQDIAGFLSRLKQVKEYQL